MVSLNRTENQGGTSGNDTSLCFTAACQEWRTTRQRSYACHAAAQRVRWQSTGTAASEYEQSKTGHAYYPRAKYRRSCYYIAANSTAGKTAQCVERTICAIQ